MGWIGVETLPLTERKADLPLVLYESEVYKGDEPEEKLDVIYNVDKWTKGRDFRLGSD